MIPADEIVEMRKRVSEATPGPWVSFVEAREKYSGSDVIRTAGEDIYLSGATVADQDFIAHARQDLPKVLDELERLRRMLDDSEDRAI